MRIFIALEGFHYTFATAIMYCLPQCVHSITGIIEPIIGHFISVGLDYMKSVAPYLADADCRLPCGYKILNTLVHRVDEYHTILACKFQSFQHINILTEINKRHIVYLGCCRTVGIVRWFGEVGLFLFLWLQCDTIASERILNHFI